MVRKGAARVPGIIRHGVERPVRRTGGGRRRTGDYSTPTGIVENSATESGSAEAGGGWSRGRLFAIAGATLNDGRYGVPFAGEFHGHHEEESGGHEDDAHGETAIALDWQRRAMRFDIGVHGLTNHVVEGVQLSLNAIDGNHNELEIEGGSESVGTRYDNRTYILRADLDQRQTGRLSGRFGAWARVRDFEAAGVEALAPRPDLASFAAFAYKELTLGRFRVQFGGRLERDSYQAPDRTGEHPHQEDDDHHDHAADHDDHDADHDEEEHHLEAPDPRDREFAGASASVGLHAELGAGNALVANPTRSHRSPAIEELYNFGPHVGTLAFDIGNPDLDAESTLGLDLSLRHRGDHFRGALNFFVYEIDNFIFGNRSGEVIEGLPVFNVLQGDSRFVGFDGQGSIRIAGQAWATLGLGRVGAKLTASGEALPRIPPRRGSLSVDPPHGGFTLSPRLMFAAKQDDVFRGESLTEGYTVLDLRASYVWPRLRTAHIVSFTASNVTNALYRNLTSFIKDRAPEMGRGVRVSYAVRFH